MEACNPPNRPHSGPLRSAEPHNINSRNPPVNSRPLKPVSHGEQRCTGKRMTTRRLSTVDRLPKSQAVTTFAHSLAYPLRHRQDLLGAAERKGRRTMHSQATYNAKPSAGRCKRRLHSRHYTAQVLTDEPCRQPKWRPKASKYKSFKGIKAG